MWKSGSSRRYFTSAEGPQHQTDDPALWPSDHGPYFDPFFQGSSTGRSDEARQNHDTADLPIDLSNRITIDPLPEETTKHEVSLVSAQGSCQQNPVEIPSVLDKVTKLMEIQLWTIADKEDHLVYDISTLPAPSKSESALTKAGIQSRGVLERQDVHQTDFVPTTQVGDQSLKPFTVLNQLLTTIWAAKRRDGTTAAGTLTREAMEIYAAGGGSDDFHAIDQLLIEFSVRLRLPRHARPVHKLIQHLLSTNSDAGRRRAGRLLFKRDIHEIQTDDRAISVLMYEYEREAVIYIHWMCSTDASNFKVVLEFRKVLGIASHRGVPPGEQLFYPVLDRFLERGELNYLRNMFDEMTTAYGVQPTALTKKILLLGYARAHDWDQITIEFEAMHKQGFSRTEPISYATMFDEVLKVYAASEPVEKVHDFLVNAICYWGLVPLSTVSATAVQAYIRHRRYDLIKEWVEAARGLFPQVNTNGNRFAFILGQTWAGIGASCQEIEEACVAIFQGRGNVVPGRFRSIVQEALAGHLARKLHGIESAEGISDGEVTDHQSNMVEDSDNLSAQLKSAFAVILEDAGDSGVVKQSSVADLLMQSSAAVRLRELFGARNSIAVPAVEVAPRLDRPARSQSSLSKAQTTAISTPVPEELRRELLPARTTITSLMSTYYLQLLKQNNAISHDVLKSTCRQLNVARRHHDVLELLKGVYDSAAVQGPNGVMFDLDVISIWMEAAYHLKSPHACLQVFRALLEKGSAIRLTSQFMLLARMAPQKAFGTKFRHRNKILADLMEEMKYVLNTLTDRFYAQRKNAEPKRGRMYDGMLTTRNADTDKSFASAWKRNKGPVMDGTRTYHEDGETMFR